jgi:sRNA-binding regulator protein Hfq
VALDAVLKGFSMKDAVDSGNRKLIRPSLSALKEQQEERERRGGPQGVGPQRTRRAFPPGQTNAESFYYLKQMQNQTPMALVLTDGEILHGVIEWYDKACLKLNRKDGTHLVVYKESIKYLYKESDKGVRSETSANGAAASQSMTA